MAAPQRVHWDEGLVDRLRRMHAAGCSDDEIALAMRVPVMAVRLARARLKLLANKSNPYSRSLRKAEG